MCGSVSGGKGQGMEYVLQTEGLGKRYGHFKALCDVTMHVPKGAIYGFVGKNGAGKTTLIRLICGLQEPTEGSYTLYGIQSREGDMASARRRMGAVVETPSIYMDMTAQENLMQQYQILGRPSSEGMKELLSLVGLADTGCRKAKHFSLGMRQRLGIAAALAGDPDFLVLDEPANGLDPQGIVEIRELILRLNRERKITVLMSSHILDELSRLATHYGFLDHGHMVKEISAKELEEACRKRIRVEVSDTKALVRVLDGLGLPYTVWTETKADIYGTIGVTELVLRLHEEQCEVRTMEEKDESLESYYIRLIGGEDHA
jgi:ABC-2 type transport system ATP-binding protein